MDLSKQRINLKKNHWHLVWKLVEAEGIWKMSLDEILQNLKVLLMEIKLNSLTRHLNINSDCLEIEYYRRVL